MHAPASDPRQLTRLVLIDGELHHVISRSPASSFADLNRRRAALGRPPVQPASSLALTAHEARAHAAVQIREWRRRYGLRLVGGRR